MNLSEFKPQSLANPIHEDFPTGEDLRQNTSDPNPFRTIKDAEAQARRLENAIRSADPQDIDEERRPNNIKKRSLEQWRVVRDQSVDALKSRTKDLEVAVSLLDALIRTNQFEGFNAGIQALSQLVQQFWPTLHPQEEISQQVNGETKVLSIPRLLRLKNLCDGGEESLLQRTLRFVPLNSDDPQDATAFWQAETGASADSVAQFESAVRSLSPEAVARLAADLKSSQTELDSLNDLLNTRHREAFGSEWHPFKSTARRVEGFHKILARVRPDIVAGEPSASAENSDESNTDAAAAAPEEKSGTVPGKPLRNREDAFKILVEVADFFARTEPQSLLPSLLKRTVELGRMPPEEYFKSIIASKDSLKDVFRLHGIKPQQPSDD